MKDDLLALASQCLKCKNPQCIKGCPASNNIPMFINFILEEDYQKAYEELIKTNLMPEICGDLCDHQKQCEGKCIRNNFSEAVAIGKLESSIGKMFFKNYNYNKAKKSNIRLAIVGSGVTGIVAARILANAGTKVTIFEKENYLGGTIKKYIPDFRYNFDNDFYYQQLINLGVEIKFNKTFGENLLIDEIMTYDYQIIAIGAQYSSNLDLNGPSIYHDLEILDQYNRFIKNENYDHDLIKKIKSKEVVVIGAGNVAMDVARVLRRLDCKVKIVYRRNLENSPASKKEIINTINEGVECLELLSPIATIIKDNNLIGLKTQRMQVLPKTVNEKRARVVAIENSFEEVKCDVIVFAIGGYCNYDYLNLTIPELFTDHKLTKTRVNNLFLGGDCVTGPLTVVDAMVSGRNIAHQIIKEINENENLSRFLDNKTVLFGGSFNPPTCAHDEMISYLSKNFNVKIIINPNADNYYAKDLVPFYHRVAMLKLLTKDLSNVTISDYEQINGFKGSVNTLRYFNHPIFVIGADSLMDLPNWIDAENLIAENKFLIFNRNNTNIDEVLNHNPLLNKYKHNFYIAPFIPNNYSSSEFRNHKTKKIITTEVYNYIITNNLYSE